MSSQAVKVLASYQTCLRSRIILLEHYNFSVDQFWHFLFEWIIQIVQFMTVHFKIDLSIIR